MAVRQPIAQKFAIFATAITELLDWDKVLEFTEQDDSLGHCMRLLLATAAKFLDWNNVRFNHLADYNDETDWPVVKEYLFPDFKARVTDSITQISGFPNKENM